MISIHRSSSRGVRRAGNVAREKFEEGGHRCSKREGKAPTLPPPSAPQRAFSAPLERAGALARAPFEPQPQQHALLQPLAWAQQATVPLLTMLRL